MDGTDIKIGVCGFCLPQSELFTRFNLLEVQQTFYWPPQLKTVERWRLTAPDNFEFSLKAFQAITHTANSRTYRRTKFSDAENAQCGAFRDTPVIRDAWQLTRSLALAMRATMVVFQCPPSFMAREENVANLRQFFERCDRGPLKFAWEPRHASWTIALVSELCRDLNLIHAVDPFEQPPVYGLPQYFRLHGKALSPFHYDYGYVYSDTELGKLQDWCQAAPTYCLFNNKQMASDAQRFEKLLDHVKN